MIEFGARKALFIATFFLLLGATATAQDNFIVKEVLVVGNRRATESLILSVASINRGSALTPTDVSETIRRLHRLGIFDDISVQVEQETDGIKVYIVVRELPKLSDLKFEGNKKIDDKDLKENINIGVGGYISPYLIFSRAREIKKRHAEKGYFQAEVNSSLQYNQDSSEAALTYTIDEKSKVKVEKVVLTGNNRVPAEDIIGKMRNRKRGFLKSSDFAQDKYAEDLKKIIEEFHKRGFVEAYLISDSMSIDSIRNRMTIFLEVYEGPRFYFGDVEFVDNVKFTDPQLTSLMPYRKGDIFNKEKYDESIGELYSAYHDIGHLHAGIADERTTLNDSVIDVTYRVAEGLPSKINLVKIVGNVKTKEKVIRREISALPGSVYNRSVLIRSIRDIMSLNFFDQVLPELVDLPNGDVDVEFTVEEKQTAQISAGAGFNSRDKVVGNFGLGIPNFRGNGQNLSFNVDFGKSRNSFSLSFTEPWMFGRPTLLSTSAFILNRRWFSDYTEGRQGGSIRVGRRLRWPDNYFRIFSSYQFERNRFFDFEDAFRLSNSTTSRFIWEDIIDTTIVPRDSLAARLAFPGSILEFEEQWRTASRFSVTIRRDSRNLPEFATSGSTIAYTFENTGGLLGGFWQYQKHSLSLAKFFPLFWGMALAAKVEYGVVTSPDGDSRVWLTDRFTPGGTSFDGVVRGYDDGSLTPDSTVTLTDTIYTFLVGNPSSANPVVDTTFNSRSFETRVRGKYMLVTNIEWQIPLVARQIYALMFFDAGNSWLHNNQVKPITGLHKAYGLGFRIVIPGMGTLGFDFGYPLDPLKGKEKGWKPHFQFGTTFR